MKPYKRVVFVTLVLNQYRKEFLGRVRDQLASEGIEFVLLYSKSPNQDVAKKGDEIDIEWGHVIPVKRESFMGVTFYWQQCLPWLRNSDLVILQQENKILLIYYLILFRRLKGLRMAFWGHGTNLQKPQNSPENRFKRFIIKRCDWWFAYTERVKQRLVSSGFPANKISVNQNAIDTKALAASYEGIDEMAVHRLREKLGITSTNVALFCGSIYREKQIDFLLEAARLVKERIPDFHLIVIGSGNEAAKVEAASQQNHWIHYAGPKFGDEKVTYFRLAKMHLMPGLVGLAILDSFALRTPMVTTDYPFHSPEIEYLRDGYNGVITPFNVTAYADAVSGLFEDPAKLALLIEGCEASRGTYTVEQMSANFVNGVNAFYRLYFPAM